MNDPRTVPSSSVPLASLLLASLLLAPRTAAQDSTAPAVAQDPATSAIAIDGLPKSGYHLLPARQQTPPDAGFGLLVVLPGGDGSSAFLPWVQNGIHAQAPDDFVCALVTAPVWSDKQKIVWPTAARKERGMEYTTEDYVRAVVAHVAEAQPIDAARRVVLGWSSSGPALYDLLLSDDNPFPRAYLAMSVFPRQSSAALKRASGLRVLLDQSPDDEVTRFVEAERAHAALTKAGAVVQLVSYRGGHGWQDDPQARLRRGLEWLLSDRPATRAQDATEPAAPAAAVGADLLRNGSFEDGGDGWQVIDNSGNLRHEQDRRSKKHGKASLHLTKTGGLPLDLLRQDVDLPDGASVVTARAWVRSSKAGNAFVKCFLFDAAGETVHADVDLVHLRGDRDWQQVEKSWPKQTAVRAAFQVVLVLGGEVWIDGAELVAGK